MAKKETMNLAMKVGSDHLAEARSKAGNFGVTNLYSTGDAFIDEYLGGGYGRKDGYEIVTVFGDTGQNKSTFISQMVIAPACKGTKVAYLALEDEMSDVINRIDHQIPSGPGFSHESLVKKCLDNIYFLPENDGYTLEKIGDVIENLFGFFKIVVIDPIQFIFEASVVESKETEFNRQRLFMRRMNNIMKNNGYTLLLVSHTNKSGDAKSRADAGMFKIIGSSAIAQVSTKVLEIGRSKEGTKMIQLHKSRFTRYRKTGIQVHVTPDMRIATDFTNEEKKQIRAMWEG